MGTELFTMETPREENALSAPTELDFTITPVEKSVVELAKGGDKAAFENVFMSTYRYVFATVRKYLKNDEDAYDAIQSTYLRVYKGFSRLESVDSFYPWLHRIAENCAKDIFRKNQAAGEVSFDEKFAADASEEGSDVTADVTAVLKQMPAEQAELLVRIYYDKMSVAEIARMQSVPATTIHNRLKAAKKKIRELLLIRGIDKPIYGGEFVSMIATAIRNAIGTELLSLAVAEEILHNVRKSVDEKGAFVVATFARQMRNRAAKRIANALVLVSVLLTVALFIIAMVLTKNTTNNDGKELQSNTSIVSSKVMNVSSDEGNSLTGASSVVESSSVAALSSDVTSADGTSSKYDFFPMIPETDISMTGLLSDEGNLGTFSENGKLPIATTRDAIYVVSNGALVSVNGNSFDAVTIHCSTFGSLYTEKSSFLNVYDGRVYWIDTEGDSRFVLNRANLDGSGHYSVVFEEEECSYLTKLLVAEEGVYFTAGIHNDYMHTGSGTLYRTDFDFFVKDRKSGIADYAIVGERLYYIEGKGNYGDIYYADRNTLEKKGTVFTDHFNHGSLYAFGDYLIANRNTPYGHSWQGGSPGYMIIDTRTNENVRRVDGEDTVIEILDASGYDGGTLIFRWGKEVLVQNIESGKIRDYTSEVGVMIGGYNYYLDADTQSFMMCDVKTNKKYRIY